MIVLFTPVVTVLAGPLSPGVKSFTTPGVLVKAGGGAGLGVAAGATTGAGAALVEELQPLIDDVASAGAFETGGGAAEGGDTSFGGRDASLGGGITVEPLSTDTAGRGGRGGGGIKAAVVIDTEVADEVMTTPLSVDTTGGRRALEDEVEELYIPADVRARGIGAIEELLEAIDSVAKIGPWTILLVGNIGARTPGLGIGPMDEADVETPFLADTIPALLEAGSEVESRIEAEEATKALLEAKEPENPRGGGSTVPKPGLGPEGGDEEYSPFIVKFAHVMMVLLA